MKGSFLPSFGHLQAISEQISVAANNSINHVHQWKPVWSCRSNKLHLISPAAPPPSWQVNPDIPAPGWLRKELPDFHHGWLFSLFFLERDDEWRRAPPRQQRRAGWGFPKQHALHAEETAALQTQVLLTNGQSHSHQRRRWWWGCTVVLLKHTWSVVQKHYNHP